MARKWYSHEDCLKTQRQVELDLAAGGDVAKACRTAWISDTTYTRGARSLEGWPSRS